MSKTVEMHKIIRSAADNLPLQIPAPWKAILDIVHLSSFAHL